MAKNTIEFDSAEVVLSAELLRAYLSGPCVNMFSVIDVTVLKTTRSADSFFQVFAAEIKLLEKLYYYTGNSKSFRDFKKDIRKRLF